MWKLRLGCMCLMFMLLGCGGEPSLSAASGVSRQSLADPLLEKLQALPGVTVVEVPSRPGERGFILTVSQPADHFAPNSARFSQRVLLLHRDVSQPMVLSTTGYGLFGLQPRDNEVSHLLSGNSLIVEHRFFGPSTPSPVDWRQLTIRQAAWDHHRIVELLKPIYTARWISTGASKGGMASLYHRRFFPNDVDGTVAYVAPQSYGTDDPRYPRFLERVGSEACRQRIIDFQRAALDRHTELLPLYEQQALDYGVTYQHAGGLDVVFEHSVQELRFALWQYGDEDFCVTLPAADAPARDLMAALDVMAGPADLGSDQMLDVYAGYYYQAAAQLGSYGPLESHLRGRLRHPGSYRVERYAPVSPRFDHRAMPEVQAWLALFGHRVMFVYGENDPWSAGMFELGAARDSFRYVVPQGNHGSYLFMLPAEQQSEALDALSRWAGVTLAPAAVSARVAGAMPAEWKLDRQRPSLFR